MVDDVRLMFSAQATPAHPRQYIHLVPTQIYTNENANGLRYGSPRASSAMLAHHSRAIFLHAAIAVVSIFGVIASSQAPNTTMERHLSMWPGMNSCSFGGVSSCGPTELAYYHPPFHRHCGEVVDPTYTCCWFCLAVVLKSSTRATSVAVEMSTVEPMMDISRNFSHDCSSSICASS